MVYNLCNWHSIVEWPLNKSLNASRKNSLDESWSADCGTEIIWSWASLLYLGGAEFGFQPMHRPFGESLSRFSLVPRNECRNCTLELATVTSITLWWSPPCSFITHEIARIVWGPVGRLEPTWRSWCGPHGFHGLGTLPQETPEDKPAEAVTLLDLSFPDPQSHRWTHMDSQWTVGHS